MVKALVRLLILSASIYSILECVFAYFGVNISSLRYILGHSLIVDVCLIIFCGTQGKYHCKYMKYLCYNLAFISVFNYFDSLFNIIPNATSYIYILSASWMVAILLL